FALQRLEVLFGKDFIAKFNDGRKRACGGSENGAGKQPKPEKLHGASVMSLLCKAKAIRGMNMLFLLRQEHRQTFAGATRFQEFRHRQWVSAESSTAKLFVELRAALGQDDVFFQNHRVTGELQGFFGGHLYGIFYVFLDRARGV